MAFSRIESRLNPSEAKGGASKRFKMSALAGFGIIPTSCACRRDFDAGRAAADAAPTALRSGRGSKRVWLRRRAGVA
jgi:hypothetical protein